MLGITVIDVLLELLDSYQQQTVIILWMLSQRQEKHERFHEMMKNMYFFKDSQWTNKLSLLIYYIIYVNAVQSIHI